MPPGKNVLLINLDETRVCRSPAGGRGNVMVSKRDYRRRPLPTRRATRSQRRSGLTHVALIADRSDVQAVLPQVFVHCEHFPTSRVLR